jgi:NAD(P)-dependent dehydrogenase (short-subunit alcohol dehydrogenase family)
MTDPNPKALLLIGASRGLGAAMAEEFAKRGCRERRLAFAKRLYAGELPDAALLAFAEWNG